VCDNAQGSNMWVMSMRQQCKRLKANIFIILEPEMCSQYKQLDTSFHQPIGQGSGAHLKAQVGTGCKAPPEAPEI
jgi:hypothetical protein